MNKFSKIIFDLDGVIYRGHTPIRGAAQAISKIKSSGIRVAYLTNNATRSRRELASRLFSMGIPATMDEVMPSSYAAARFLSQMKPRPKSVFVLGEKGLRHEIRAAGFNVLPPVLKGEKADSTTFSHLAASESAPKADILLSGLDRNVTYAKFAAALDVLHSGAKWVACNLDPTLPMENGAHPGSGSLNALLGYAAGEVNHEKHKRNEAARWATRRLSSTSPSPLAALSQIRLREPDVVVGKPNPFMLELLAGGQKSGGRQAPARRSFRPRCLFVGDRLDTDIQFANAAGLVSLLVLTGVAKKKEAEKARGPLRPHFILPSVAQMPKWLGL